MPTCPSCQHELKAGVKFCVYCGTAVQVNVPAPQPPPATAPSTPPPPVKPACPHCGAANAPGVKFCNKCGQPMTGSGPRPQVARPATAPATASAPAARPSRPSPLPIIAVGAAMLAVAGAAWFFFRTDGTAKPETAGNRQIPFVTEPSVEQPGTPAEPAPPAVEVPAPAVAAAPPAASTPPPSRPAPTRPVVSTPAPAPSIPAPAPRAAQPPPQTVPEPKPEPAAPAEVVRAPVTQALPAAAAPAPSEAPRRTEILRPEREFPAPTQPRPTPAYQGASSGVIIWSGQLEKGAAISISGNQSSVGTVNGALPGVPVLIEVDPKDVGVAEAPGPSNGWKGFSLRSRKGRHTVVTIRWRVL